MFIFCQFFLLSMLRTPAIQSFQYLSEKTFEIIKFQNKKTCGNNRKYLFHATDENYEIIWFFNTNEMTEKCLQYLMTIMVLIHTKNKLQFEVLLVKTHHD